MRLTDFNERQKLNILIYGDTGTGKSVRAASSAMWGDVYIFDFDLKVGGISEWMKGDPGAVGRIHYDEYADDPGRPNACIRAYQKLKEIWAECKKGTPPYTTIVWDSWTAWEQLYLAQVMATNPGFKRMKMDAGPISILVPDQADYRIHAHCQSTFIPQLVSLPMNVIVVAHTNVKIDEITGAIDRGVAAAGKLSKTLPKYFGEVHRSFVRGGEYLIQVRSDHQYPANTRLKEIPKDGILRSDLNLFTPMAMVSPSLKGVTP